MADLSMLLGAAGLGGAIGQAIVRLELDTKKYQAELAAAEAKTNTGAKSMGSSLAGFGSLATTGLLAVGAGFVKMAVDGVRSLERIEQLNKATANAIEATGGAANVTAADITTLAQAQEDLTGIEAEAIQNSQNLLLTFRDVRNELGAGNDIFDQATIAIEDMSTALNQGAIPSSEDLQQSTIQLGKALNDPIRGMTALRRIGVSFNESQVETITRLQESGDLMGAQKVILAELRAEFGGAAEAAGDTFAGKIAKLGHAFGALEESLARVLLPAITAVVDGLSDLSVVLLFATGNIEDFNGRVRESAEDFVGFELNVAKWAGTFAEQIPIVGKGVELWGQYQDALHPVNEELIENGGIVGTLTDFYQGEFTDAIEDSNKAARQAGRSFAGMGDDLQEWSDDVKESFGTYVLALEESEDAQADTQRGFNAAIKNMLQDARSLSQAMRLISREKWVNDEFIAFLSEQGPEWLIGFSKLTEEQQHRAQEAWRKSTEKTDAAKESLDKVTGVLDTLGRGKSKHKVIIEYEYVGFDPSKPGMGGVTPRANQLG